MAHVQQRVRVVAAEPELPQHATPPVVAGLVLAGIVLGAGDTAGLGVPDLLVAPLSLALAGGFFALRRWWRAARLRARADAWIALGHERLQSAYGWRIAELTSRRERRLLARSLRGVVTDLAPDRLPGAAPLNRAALRPHADLLVALAGRLDAVDRPVSAAGILGVRHLLTGPGSPLYVAASAEPVDVAPALTAVIDRLEVD